MYQYIVDLIFGNPIPALGRNMPLTLTPELITTSNQELQEVISKLRKVRRNPPYRSPQPPLFKELNDYFINKNINY